MGASEEFFWNNTPKKILALIHQRREMDKENMKALAVYVGCVFAGKSFDEIEESEVVEGIDKPVSQDALRSLII